MKNIVFTFALFLFVFHAAQSQCGNSEFCNANTGLYSNDDAGTIAYDNMGSAFHSTFIKEPNGGWRLWGEDMANNGTGDLLSPTSFTVANYPALTGTIYKMGLGSNSINNVQLVVLTSTGLFALGNEGIVISNGITTSDTFQKLTINGKTDGLPVGIGPTDVRMMYVTTSTIIITTCLGDVYVLSQNPNVRGNGGVGTGLEWARVMQDAATPLSNVIVARGNSRFGYALKADGTLWTWGDGVYLGDGSAASAKTYATQMVLPVGMPGIKVIQATSQSTQGSYYILGTDKKVYALGSNGQGQLGDRTSTLRTVWVNAKNPDNSIITDAAWISANEHDALYSGLAIIKTGGVLYTAGSNSSFMLGRAVNGGVNHPELPAGVFATDVITQAEVGGHTCALIKLGSPRYGYVGHRINGSMGNGVATGSTVQVYDFLTPPIIAVCGTLCTTPAIATNSPICPGQDAVFTISGTPGDIVTYTMNNGGNQNVTIGPLGSVVVTVPAPSVAQNIHLNYILGGTGACSNGLSISAAVTIGGGNFVPIFNQVDPICVGGTLSPLPTTSTNGVVGSWSPALNSSATTTYTFTPASSACGGTTTMTVGVIVPGTVPSFNQVPPICQGDALVLPAVSLEGIPGTWSPAINNNTTMTYTFTPSVTGACFNQTAQMTVVVHNSNMFPTFDPIAAICNGDPLPALPTTSLEGIPGTWSPAPNNTQTTTYTFSPIVNTCAATVQMTIEVNPWVTPVFDQVDPVCEGTPVAALPTGSINSVSGTWSPPMTNMATTTYTFTPDSGICAYNAQMTVVVIPRETPVFPNFGTLCYADANFVLPLVSNNNINGSWSPAFNNTATATYTFTPDSGECANTATMQVNVFSDFDFVYEGYCRDGDFMLEVLPNSSFNINGSSVDWQYNNVNVGTGTLFNVTSYLNGTTATEMLPYTFTVTLTDQNGCDKTKTIVLDNIYCGIQKGISINYDGLNEFFDLRLLDVDKLSIFNRYGVKVYSKENYYDEWHGQADNGDILPDGTYYYLIDFADQASKTGWIYVIREH